MKADNTDIATPQQLEGFLQAPLHETEPLTQLKSRNCCGACKKKDSLCHKEKRSTFKEIELTLQTATHPVAKALHIGNGFKTLAIGFKKGMVLKEHQVHIPTKLFVLQGGIIYKENDSLTTLSLHEEVEIPVNVLHTVTALEDSLCLLTQG